MSRRIVLNTAVQLLGKAISTLSSIVVTFIIGRQLGPEFYGDFTKIFATSTLLFMVLDFGLNATAVKHLTRSPRSQTPEFQHLLGLRLSLALLLYLGILAVMRFTPSGTTQGYTPIVKAGINLFSLGYFAQATFLTSNSVFQARLRYQHSVIAASLGSLTQLISVLIAVKFSPTLISISLAHLLGSFIMAAVSLALVKPFVTSLTPRLSRAYVLSHFAHTAPISIALIFNLFATRLDTILLSLYRPTAEVGYYGLARRVFDVVLVIPTFFTNAAYPVFLEKIHHRQSLTQPVTHALFILISTSLLASLSLLVFAPLLTLIRPDFAPAIPALRFLSLSLPLFFTTNLCMWLVIALNQQTRLIPIYALTFLFNSLTNLVFIPKFGYLTPAVVTGLTEALVLLFFYRLYLHYRPILSNLKDYAKSN